MPQGADLAPRIGLGTLNRNLRGLIDVLSWQVEQCIQCSFVLNIASSILVEDPSIQHLGESHAVSLLHFLDAIGPALSSRLFRNRPVRLLGTSHPQGGLEHIFLADCKGLDVHNLVLELFKAVGLGLNRQAKKSSHTTTDLISY